MHKTVLFTIIYCNFFTDSRFLTVRLSVVCCDMSVVDYEDYLEKGVTVILPMETCWDKQGFCVPVLDQGWV